MWRLIYDIWFTDKNTTETFLQGSYAYQYSRYFQLFSRSFCIFQGVKLFSYMKITEWKQVRTNLSARYDTKQRCLSKGIAKVDQEMGHCNLDLCPGDLKIKTWRPNIGNVYPKKIYVKLTKIMTRNGFHENGQGSLDLWPGDLKINRCLKTKIDNMYAKSQ